MAKYIASPNFAEYVKKVQGTRPTADFAASLEILRQTLRSLLIGAQKPTPKILAALKLETVYRVRATGKYIKPEELGKYLAKLQGGTSDKEFVGTVGITRHTLGYLRSGEKAPIEATLGKLGLELYYKG